jgi:hypothetical protein
MMIRTLPVIWLGPVVGAPRLTRHGHHIPPVTFHRARAFPLPLPLVHVHVPLSLR